MNIRLCNNLGLPSNLSILLDLELLVSVASIALSSLPPDCY